MSVTNTEDGNAKVLLLVSLVSHLLAIAAVVRGSHIALRRWIAVRSLQPAVSLKDSRPVADGEAQTNERQVTNTKILLAAVIAIVIVGGRSALFRYAGMSRFDLAWIATEFYVLYSAAMRVQILESSTPTTVRYVPDPKSSILRPNFDTEVNYPQIVAAVFSIAVLGTTSMGSVILRPVVVALVTLNAFGAVGVSKWSVRRSVTALCSLTLGLGALAVAGGSLCPPVASGFDRLEDSDPQLCSRLDPLAISVLTALPFVAAGTHVALALKYDHVTSGLYVQVRQVGESVEVPTRAPDLPKPTFYAALSGLGASIILLNLYARLNFQDVHSSLTMELGGPVVVIPAVILCSFLSALYRGKAAEFWKYEERWTSFRGIQASLQGSGEPFASS